MKLNAKILPSLTALLGGLTLLARMGLYRLGTDEKGLLAPHPLGLLCWCLTAGAVVLALLWVRRAGTDNAYGANFRPSLLSALGCLVLAGGIALSLEGDPMTRLTLLGRVLGFGAIPALALAGLCRLRGRQPFFAFHGIACLYLILHAVSHYQLWCSQPQLQDYFFELMATVFLTLFCYYQTAFDVDRGSRRMQIFTGLMAGFFGIAALPGTGDPALYAAGALWALTNLCRLTPEEAPHEAA